MSSRQRRILIRRHKEAIIAWRVAARISIAEEWSTYFTDLELALRIERGVALPSIEPIINSRYTH